MCSKEQGFYKGTDTDPMTSAERQQLLRDRRLKAGLVRKEYWATKKEHTKLKDLLSKIRNRKK